MKARGLWVPSWMEVAAVPVVLWTGRAVLLTADGGYGEAA